MRIRRPILGLTVAGSLALAGLAGAPGEAWADPDVFAAPGIAVDVTAKTAASAREDAHAQGHTAAMRTLMERLLPRAALTQLPPIEAGQVAELVKDFAVADERTSDVRYLATLSFRFRPDAVRNFLRGNGLAHAETRSKPVVVLPVFGPFEIARLWEASNPWWAAWATRPPSDRLVPLIVPLGDLGDISTADAQHALTGDLDRLARLAARYDAEDVLITQAVLDEERRPGGTILRVGTSRLGRQQRGTVIETYRRQPGETVTDLLARAAEAVADEVQERWKQQNVLGLGAQRKITVAVPIRAHSDWLEIKKRLAGVAAVQGSRVAMLSRTETKVDITFVGEEQQLVLAMAQSDLDLIFDPDDGWRLWISGAKPVAGQTAPAGE